jgi:DNA mismatch repair protein MutS2
MVLPLKAEYRGRIDGIIHRSSDSGATLFVEPSGSVELNNTIVRLRDEESKEITRILRALTQRVFANAETILGTLDAIAILDLIAAKCKYAKKRACVCPMIDDDGVLDLHEARHPLLLEFFEKEAGEGEAPREVVPIDVRLGDDFDVLVITGPNTGGKTVVIKTVGLLALMTQCGIPIPAGPGSRMPVYKRIFIDIGDEQSLQQSLSTFSSHLSNQLSILERCGATSLVLIDELGAGTDPDEGAAIGRSILAELLGRKARAVVTTHLSALKAVAYTTARVDNASVEFDPQSLRPTYQLRIGEPGNSNALIIAKRLGMPQRLVQQAHDYLADTGRALDRAIAGTQQSRRDAEQARKAARESALQAEREKAQYEKDRLALAAQQQAFERWTKWVNQLKPGDEVFLRSLHRPAKVVRMQLHKQTALVTSGAMDIEVALRDVAMPAEAP